MKVLLIHNYYGFTGGEDIYFDNLIDYLKQINIEVIVYSKNLQKIKSKFEKIKSLAGFFYSFHTTARIRSIILKEKPDIAHINNIFPLISPSIYRVLAKNNIPVIQTLHNYRLFCSNGLCLKNNEICTKCLKNSIFNIFNVCRKDKKIYDFFLGINVFFIRLLFLKYVSKFIALSNFQREMLIASGVKREKIVLIRNIAFHEILEFGPDNDMNQTDNEFSQSSLPFTENEAGEAIIENEAGKAIKENGNGKKYFLYIGRLSEEKGIKQLVNYFLSAPDKKLLVCGGGPLFGDLDGIIKASSVKNVFLLGFKNKKELQLIMKGAYSIIIPSICFDVLPLVVLEGLKAGIPLIVNDIGSLSEIIEDGKNGFKYKNYSGLGKILDDFVSMGRDEMHDTSENCLILYEKFFNSADNIKELLKLYSDLIAKVKDL